VEPDATNPQRLDSSSPSQVTSFHVPRRRCTAVVSVSAIENLRNCMVGLPPLNFHDLSVQNHASTCGIDKNFAGDGVKERRGRSCQPTLGTQRLAVG